MKTAHPTFDMQTRTWFVDELEASSLAGLKKLLPGVKFKDYYPKGDYRAPPWPKDPPKASRIHVNVRPDNSIYFKRRSALPEPQAVPVDLDEAVILDWVAGLSKETIADKYQIAETVMVGRILRKAFQNGDERAAPRLKGDVPRPRNNKRKIDHEAILNMWAAGISGPEIGRRLGLARSTSAGGIVCEYRKRGDPRARARASIMNVGEINVRT